MKNTYRMIHLIPLLLSIVFLLFRTVPTILSGQFTFAFDMGRDLLWVRNMVELHKPTLIGPWGSIAGVYFGPLWFYLLSIPYVLFNGDPRGAVVVPLVSNIATLFIGWWFLRRKKHPAAANIWVVLYGFSPLVISTSGFAFHANLLPLVTLIFLIGFCRCELQETGGTSRGAPRPGTPTWVAAGLTGGRTRLWLGFPLAAFMASIAFHLEPAAGVVLTLFFGCTLIFNVLKISWYARTSARQPLALQVLAGGPYYRPPPQRGKRSTGVFHLLAYSFIAFSLPFTPQMVFELRHDFIQTKALVSYFRGENESLGGVLPLAERIPERITKFARTLSQSALPLEQDSQKWVLLGAFLIAVLWLIKIEFLERFTNNELRITVAFLLFHYFFYTFLFPPELKNWYLFGFASVFLMAIALVLDESIRYLRLKVSDTFKASVVITLVVLVWFWKTANPLELIKPTPSSPVAPETLAAQLEVVDWIYQDATSNGKPFSVYTYTPPIYDYTYQYLLWWRGTRKYQILPAEFSYQRGETSYLPEKGKFVSSKWKPEDAEIIYLILEPDSIESRQEGWLGHFSKFSYLNEHRFPTGVIVQIRET